MVEPGLTLIDVWEGLHGVLVAARSPAGVTFSRAIIDSREAAPGDLFFALRGGRSDAHDFVPDAFRAGAAGAVVARPVAEAPEDAAVFHVSDPLEGLQRLAASWRARHTARVVGVTGSVGKTTAKEVIASVLSRRYNTLKSEANLNTEIGVPLTLLKLNALHERAVLEMAMYVPGDIALLARLARPAVGVVTNVGPVHMERAGSVGRIAAAKAELVEALPSDGLAVLNGDDARVAAMARRTRARSLLFGLSPQCDFRATDIESRGLNGFSFTLVAPPGSQRIECPLPGRHHVYPALAAAAVASEDGMSTAEIADALREVRLELRLTVRAGVRGSTVIDDSYNASPASMAAALDLLAECSGRRIAVLGHMRELGAAEAEGHRTVGAYAAGRCDALIVVGEDARLIAEAAEEAGLRDVRLVATPSDAAEIVRKGLRSGDFCLVKASRAVGLEAVVEAVAQS